MELKLEELSYQREAIDAVVQLFEGQPRNVGYRGYVIRRIFADKYRQVCRDKPNCEPTDEEIKEYSVFKTRAKEVMHA